VIHFVPQRILNRLEDVILLGLGKGYDAGLENEILGFKKLLVVAPPAGSILLDVGANLGKFTSFWIKNFGDNYIHYCFEPDSSVFIELSANLALHKECRLVNSAIGNSETQSAMLYFDGLSKSKSSLSKRNIYEQDIDFIESEEVEIIRLDDFFESEILTEIFFLKIDVEGHEVPVIESLGTRIKDVRWIQFEYGGTYLDSGYAFRDAHNILVRSNFKIFRLTPRGYEPLPDYSPKDEIPLFTTYLAKNMV
jgi:FkbM family methyltransferase